jgi:hypothetical protein
MMDHQHQKIMPSGGTFGINLWPQASWYHLAG